MAEGAADQHLLVVGASLAGVHAVEAARRSGWSGPITLIGAEPYLPYDRPPLSKALLAVDGITDFPQLRSREALDALGVDVRTEVTATGLDTARRTVITTDCAIGYGTLVIATGSRPRALRALSGVGGVHLIRGYDDALGVRSALEDARRIVVLGAGFIGSEVASAARARGIDVTIVDAGTRPLQRAVGPIAAGMLTRLHTEAGVRLVLNAALRRTRVGQGRIQAVELDNGDVLTTDAVILGIGAEPCTGWLDDSGLGLDPHSGGIVCDSSLSTSRPGVWAAGDVACIGGHTGQHWTSAAEQGRVAGANAAGAREVFTAVPFAWSAWHGHRIQTVGDTVRGQEEQAGDGFVLYREGVRVIGAVGIDHPGRIARLRRALAAPAAGAGLASSRQDPR